MKTSTLSTLAAAAALLAACETTRRPGDNPAFIPQSRSPMVEARSDPEAAPAPDVAAGWRIDGPEAPPVAATTTGSRVRAFSLAFDQAPASVVADAVIGQVLGRSYRIDPDVQASLTLSLSGRMTENQALGMLDRALRGAGAALVAEGGGFAIVPEADAARLGAAPVLVGDSQDVLSNSVIYQARSVGAAEIARLLEPLAGQGATVRADPAREQVFITGDPMTVAALVRTARSLDVDWMQGKHIQFFPVRHASPSELAGEIRQVFGGPDGPLGNQIQFVELNRLNGLMVIARSAEGLDQAAEWIARFDRSPPPAARRLRSIPLANLEAEQFVTTLSTLLTTPSTPGAGSGASTVPAPAQSADASQRAEGQATSTASAVASGVQGLRITADPRTNALILLANDAEYRDVLNVVQELDVTPPQVLIEATIAEVTLNDRLRFGVQWFFESGNFSGGFSSGSDDTAASSYPGFSLRYLQGDVSAVLNALSAVTDVQLISTPRLMVMSNEPAELKVGDQVPIITQTAVGLNADSRILNSVQYRDTGVVLSVTPRVGEGGRMFIQIAQEVSEVAGTTTSDIDSPTIQQRHVSTRIQVDDGQLVVLGGLLRTSRSLGDTGLPYLNRIPGVGTLFRSRDDTQRQTELVMFLRPTVIRSRRDMQAVSDELVSRLRALGMPVELGPN